MAHQRNSFGDDTYHEETRVRPSASFKSQIATWHANRGNKSFLSAMIPRAHVPVDGEEIVTKNPIKLLRMVDLTGWLFFFSGWFAWTCDGYDFFAVSLTVTRLSKQFHVDTKVRVSIVLNSEIVD
jgi:SHS family lactate transporter-like MFS transporter